MAKTEIAATVKAPRRPGVSDSDRGVRESVAELDSYLREVRFQDRTRDSLLPLVEAT